MANLLRAARALPPVPGVYLMKDAYGNILYVGKAKSLPQRISSYFVKNPQHSGKIQQLVQRIDHFDVLTVESEFDALWLECQKIHQYRPPYNQLMNHFEEYSYFHFANNQFKIVDSWQDSGLTLGPFYKKSKMQDFLAVVQSVYRLQGPLQYAAGIITPYTKETTALERKAEYQARLAEILDLLSGENQLLLQRIDDKVAFFATRNAYEQAQVWWEKREIAQRFLRRNKQILATQQDQYFIGILPLDCGTKYYLYYKGEILASTTYLRQVPLPQAVKKLMGKVTQKQLLTVKEKLRLTKMDVDRFPIFFNYLQRHGEVVAWPTEKAVATK